MNIKIEMIINGQPVSYALEPRCNDLIINNIHLIQNGELVIPNLEQLGLQNVNQQTEALGNNQPNNLLPNRDDVN